MAIRYAHIGKHYGCTGYCFLPDIRVIQKPDTGHPIRAGYRVSGRILGLTTIFYVKISNKFVKTALKIIDFCKH
jgi:hypothetical protein